MDYYGLEMANHVISCCVGVVATPTDRVVPASQQAPQNAATEDGDAEPEEPVKVLETQGTFDDMVVWGHEILPAADDSYVKGVEEWVRFAETVGIPQMLGVLDDIDLI